MTNPATPPKGSPNFITLRSGATQALCSVRTLRNEIARGRLRAYRVGHKILINTDDFDAYLHAREIQSPLNGEV
jgi:excisionase family DNA binding protein